MYGTPIKKKKKKKKSRSECQVEENLAMTKLQLPTLTERRERGDMIMLYKCVEGIEKIDINEYVIPSQTSLRGHSKKLYKKSLKKDVKKYSFPDRAIDKWNALAEEVVCVKSIHSFKEKYKEITSKYGTKRA